MNIVGNITENILLLLLWSYQFTEREINKPSALNIALLTAKLPFNVPPLFTPYTIPQGVISILLGGRKSVWIVNCVSAALVAVVANLPHIIAIFEFLSYLTFTVAVWTVTPLW